MTLHTYPRHPNNIQGDLLLERQYSNLILCNRAIVYWGRHSAALPASHVIQYSHGLQFTFEQITAIFSAVNHFSEVLVFRCMSSGATAVQL